MKFAPPSIYEIAFSRQHLDSRDSSADYFTPSRPSHVFLPSQPVEPLAVVDRREQEQDATLFLRNMKSMKPSEVMVDFLCDIYTTIGFKAETTLRESSEDIASETSKAEEKEQEEVKDNDHDERAIAVTVPRPRARPARMSAPNDVLFRPRKLKNSFPLYHEDDVGNINDSHSFIRRYILECFIVSGTSESCESQDDAVGHSFDGANKILDIEDKDKDEGPTADRPASISTRFAGKVAIRCRFCKHVKTDNRTKMHAVYPQSLHGIYRAFLRIQKQHIPMCGYIPASIRKELEALENHDERITRGKKIAWETSAMKLGLRDIAPDEKKGITICPQVWEEKMMMFKTKKQN